MPYPAYILFELTIINGGTPPMFNKTEDMHRTEVLSDTQMEFFFYSCQV